MPTKKKRGEPNSKSKASSRILRSMTARLIDIRRRIAARRIKRFFINRKDRMSRSIALRFCGPGGLPSFDDIKDMDFEKLSQSMREPETMETAQAFLLRVMQLCNWKRKLNPLISGSVSVKIYLAAYTIAANPDEVFDYADGVLEKSLADSSKPLVETFHKAATLFAEGKKWGDIVVFTGIPTILCTFLRDFKKWKLDDEEKLATRLKYFLEGIEEAIARIVEDDPQSSTLPDLEEEKQRLLVCVCVCVCIKTLH